MLKVVLISFGILFLGIGFIGIFVPGLPTTPFVLLSAGCFIRSSDRLYNWLLNHKLFGRYVKDFRDNKAMTLKSKIFAIIIMWSMIGCSVIFFINSLTWQLIIAGLGLTGTIVLLIIPTLKK